LIQRRGKYEKGNRIKGKKLLEKEEKGQKGKTIKRVKCIQLFKKAKCQGVAEERKSTVFR
jgi:hypothetical protein